jgi:predicted nucleic acid-binding protein
LACDVVWAEVRAHFNDDQTFEETMSQLGVGFAPISREAARLAGSLWRKNHARRRTPRFRVVADFLIGAHALLEADILLTRDRGFYGATFTRLRINDPSR